MSPVANPIRPQSASCPAQQRVSARRRVRRRRSSRRSRALRVAGTMASPTQGCQCSTRAPARTDRGLLAQTPSGRTRRFAARDVRRGTVRRPYAVGRSVDAACLPAAPLQAPRPTRRGRLRRRPRRRRHCVGSRVLGTHAPRPNEALHQAPPPRAPPRWAPPMEALQWAPPMEALQWAPPMEALQWAPPMEALQWAPPMEARRGPGHRSRH